jgi:hypothetical protein
MVNYSFCRKIMFVIIFITNLLHGVFVIGYSSDVFRPQFFAIFRELATLSTYTAYVVP